MIWIEAIQQWVDARSWSDEVIYDVENLVTPVAAGAQTTFFRNLAIAGVNKDRRQTNMVTPNQLPTGWYAKVWGVSLRVLQREIVAGGGLFTTPEDVKRILVEGVLQLTTGNLKNERWLPALMNPSPYGMTGIAERTGAAATLFSAINNGVPAQSAFMELSFPIELSNEMTFQAVYTAPGGLVLDNNTQIMVELHCIQSVPLR
jgi:hypothetical protein